MTFEEINKNMEYFNIELPKTEKVLDFYEHNVMYWIRLTEEYYNEVKLDETKSILLEEMKMEETPEILENVLEELQSANLISIKGNIINLVDGE